MILNPLQPSFLYQRFNCEKHLNLLFNLSEQNKCAAGDHPRQLATTASGRELEYENSSDTLASPSITYQQRRKSLNKNSIHDMRDVNAGKKRWFPSKI